MAARKRIKTKSSRKKPLSKTAKARKAPAGKKKAPAKKAALRKAPAKKRAAKKKAAARKAPAKRATAKKKAAPKAATKKSAPRKQPAARRASASAARGTAAAAAPQAAAPAVTVKRLGALPPAEALPMARPAPTEERIGVVTHYYSHLSVASVWVESGRLTVGDTVHIKGHTSDFRQRVDSMQVEHESVEEVSEGQEFGLKVVDHAREHDVVYKVTENG